MDCANQKMRRSKPYIDDAPDPVARVQPVANNRMLIAAQFAKAKHKDQKRKYNGRPYITHPARVFARAMLLDDASEVELCSAWLHDVIEDCKVKHKDIVKLYGSSQFGYQVADLVQELTNPSKDLPKNTPRAEKKRVDREHLSVVSTSAKRLKLIDRLDNCTELEQAPLDFIKLYSQETKLLIEAIGGTVPELNNEILLQLKLLENTVRIYSAMQKISG